MGAMLNDGRNYITDHPHVALFPGLSIVLVVIAFNLLGDGLRDVLDPKLKNYEGSCRAMLKYSVRRLIQTIPVIIGVTIVVFLLMHLIPGDAAQVIIGEGAPREQVEQIRENLGLNDPLPLQYWNYVSGLLQGDLGDSIRSSRPIADEIFTSRFWITLELAVYSTILAVFLGILAGIISAVKKSSPPTSGSCSSPCSGCRCRISGSV